MTYVLSALSLLVQIAFGAIATLFLFRLLAEAGRVDFHNPLSQFIYRYTNPVLAPIRRVLPNWRRINLAALLMVWLTLLLERALLYALLGVMPSLPSLLVLALGDLLSFVIWVYIVLIFGWSLLSMLSVDAYHPLIKLVGAVVAPVMRPLRGKLTVANIDFSPTVAIIVLLLALRLVVQPILDFGASLA